MSNLSMKWVTLLAFTTLLGVGDCSSGSLFHKEQGKYLNGSVIRTVHGNSMVECGMHCSIEPLCVSANYKISGKSIGRCELNNKSTEEHPNTVLSKNPEYTFLKKFEQPRGKKSVYSSGGLYNSLILEGKEDYTNQLITWLNNQRNWRLCYRAPANGCNANDFHSLCDGKGPTVTIVRVQEYIFGGYSDISWGGSQGYQKSADCFLFSFRNKDDLVPFKAPLYEKSHGSAIFNDPSYCAAFGSGHDICLKNGPEESFTFFGSSYQRPPDYKSHTTEIQSLLAGTYRFKPNEVEVFYLDQ